MGVPNHRRKQLSNTQVQSLFASRRGGGGGDINPGCPAPATKKLLSHHVCASRWLLLAKGPLNKRGDALQHQRRFPYHTPGIHLIMARSSPTSVDSTVRGNFCHNPIAVEKSNSASASVSASASAVQFDSSKVEAMLASSISLSDLGSNSGGKPTAAHGASSAAGHRSPPDDMLADTPPPDPNSLGTRCVIVEIPHCQARVPWPQPSTSAGCTQSKCQTIKTSHFTAAFDDSRIPLEPSIPESNNIDQPSSSSKPAESLHCHLTDRPQSLRS